MNQTAFTEILFHLRSSICIFIHSAKFLSANQLKNPWWLPGIFIFEKLSFIKKFLFFNKFVLHSNSSDTSLHSASVGSKVAVTICWKNKVFVSLLFSNIFKSFLNYDLPFPCTSYFLWREQKVGVYFTGQHTFNH